MKLEMVLTIPQQIPSEDVGRSDHSGWTSDSTVSSESLQALDQSGNDSSFCTTCYDSIINCTSDSDLCEASSLGYPFTKITKFWGSLAPFVKFRLQYILAYIGIMLADGLQGTHLYVLYEGYGFSVSSLYSLGFVSGALTSPFIGAFVDKYGRKNAAILYCVLEIIINYMEQYPILVGLISSRIIGGITTNLLCSCFEAWLITEHRQRGFAEDELEVILRDSGIVSNSAAILSGFMAHYLASMQGPKGPFQGAVATTFLALILIISLWSENYGNSRAQTSTFYGHVSSAFNTIRKDSNISRIGLSQGLVEGSLQTFVFLWSPALRQLSTGLSSSAIGIDKNGEPAYGLIFGAFMTSAVLGGYLSPILRKKLSIFISTKKKSKEDVNHEGNNESEAIPVNVLCSLCYALGAMMLTVPCLVDKNSENSFSCCLTSFLIYEFLIGVYVPSEGMIRSIYMPDESMCSTVNMLRIITNISVAVGVFSVTFVPLTFSFAVLSVMMFFASALQLSLVPKVVLTNIIGKLAGHKNSVDKKCCKKD